MTRTKEIVTSNKNEKTRHGNNKGAFKNSMTKKICITSSDTVKNAL